MESFDPDLQPARRSKLLSDLTEAVLTKGQSESDGIDGHYSLAFDHGADGLLVITVVPRK
jgi:hypothetical protein